MMTRKRFLELLSATSAAVLMRPVTGFAGVEGNWNDLCKEEQDAYIRRVENIMR